MEADTHRGGRHGARTLAAVFAAALACVLVTVGLVGGSPARAGTAVSPDAVVSPDCSTKSPESVTTTKGDVGLQATFNNPRTHDGKDTAQLRELIRLIDCTPSGQRIRMGIHHITANIVFRAIKAADNRGVTIKVVHTGSQRDAKDSTPRDLHELLGKNHHWCDHGSDGSKGWACVSTDDSGIMHSKYMLFSKTMDLHGDLRSHVVWFGSPNETYASGAEQFNNAVTVYGDATLYRKFGDKIWTPMWRENSYAGNDFYVASKHRGYFGSSASDITVYASPEQNTDLVVHRLNYIHPGNDCHLHVMEAMIHDSRSAVVDKLVSLHSKGCSVKVVAHQVTDGALRKLVNHGVSVRQAPVHDKLILFHGRYAKVTHSRYTIFTGSHNLTYSALRRNDELLVKLQNNSRAFFDAFYAHFHDAYDHGTVCTATQC